ncbi:CDP-diacylglycerol--glycerol-3-phosphate 3-phosphatidyltransferase [Quaeritorhiza haematococci]|nr:CDP-diacylglycerol--glycerol-3-phosphate 3-phosphatidyltransferase [Quaeritorhiza haematococci]
MAPVFPVTPTNVKILNEPRDFYGALKDGILNAQKRVVLASLYIGSEQTELIDVLRKALMTNPELTVDILIDYLRGTRGGPFRSSAGLLQPLIDQFPTRVRVHLYHTPQLRGLVKQLCPPRFNEGFGLQHMKIYAFDDSVILSGNGRSTSRSAISFSETQSKALRRHTPVNISPPSTTTIHAVSDIVHRFRDRWMAHTHEFRSVLLMDHEPRSSQFTPHNSKQQLKMSDKEITVVVPTIQMGPFGIRDDEQILEAVLASTSPRPYSNETSSTTDTSQRGVTRHGGSLVTLSSAYLNFPSRILDLIWKSASRFRVLTAAPQANGFFNSKGVSRHIPAAYTYLEQVFLRAASERGKSADDLTIFEYNREGWTFHAKGLWITTDRTDSAGPYLTIIGSSNFGVRSFERDLEAQALIITNNKELQEGMNENLKFLFENATPISADALEVPPRRVHPLVKVAARMIRTML